MLSAGSPPSRSSSEATLTASVRTGQATNLTSQVSRQSSVSENDEDRSIKQVPSPPPPPPFPSSFAKSKSSSRSSVTPSSASESTIKSSHNALRISNTSGFRRPTPRRDSSDSEASSVPQKKTNPPNKTPATNSTVKHLVDRNIGAKIKEIINNNSSAFTPKIKPTNLKMSTFEKVDRHSGNTTYLGTGTYMQLENCIHKYLSKNQSHNYTHYGTIPTKSTHKILTRASVLEDYSYEGITAPREQINISNDKFLHNSHYSDYDYSRHYSDYYPSRHYSDYHHSSHHTKHAADLPLDEIRQVNDALAKYGIPIFSHLNQSNNFDNRPRPVGQILSACQQLLADPLLRSQQTNAVQNVWNNIQDHSPQTYMNGYSTPAVQSVASHLFGNSNQPPYNPAQNVLSNLFNSPPQNSYYSAPPPPPPPSYPSYSSYSQPPPPPPPPPPSGSGNAGQSVLARLFSR